MTPLPDISIILPCRNEELALRQCILDIRQVFKRHHLHGEIIVSDSSIDSSPTIARALGVTLIKHDQPGYGRAYLAAFPLARGQYIFMADADGTYDFNEIPHFVDALEQGYDFCIGNRFTGGIDPSAMPALHRYLGNPALSALLRTLFRIDVGDAHCGMRAITATALSKLHLSAPGMEFASEMLIQVALNKLQTKELPIRYHRRQGLSKLRPFPDGWRHLTYMIKTFVFGHTSQSS